MCYQEAQGRYDPTKLAAVLEELKDLPELSATGFDADTLRALALEPMGELPAAELTGRVEVTLETDAESYEKLAPKLDELVRAFDLVSHVRKV